MDVKSAKIALRQQMLRRRAAIDSQVMAGRSRLCQANLLESSLWRKSRRVALYAALKGEAETRGLLEAGLRTGKEMFLPRITDAANHRMQFAPCASVEDLKPGIWKIPEPPAGQEPESVDLLVVPGVAFDREGRRLGYGAGYYDRYLAERPGFAGIIAGFCLLFQVVERVPEEEADIRVNALCTEGSLLCI